MTILDEVEELLPRLSDDEARLVVNKLRARLSLGGTKMEPAPQFRDDWLMAGIVGELRKRGLVSGKFSMPPVFVKKIAPNYERDAGEVMAAFNESVADMNPAEQMMLGKIVARNLAEWLCVPLSPQVLLRNIGHALQAFDTAYPGYLEARMVKAIIRRETDGTD